MSLFTDDKLFLLGNQGVYNYNKSLCFQATDLLKACTDKQDNKNRFRCPDELYAYEMYCPPDYQTIERQRQRKQALDEQTYNKDWLARINYERQVVHANVYGPQSAAAASSQ